MNNVKTRGIAVCNPVDFDRDYLRFTADYAIEHGINHYQFVGPIHNPEKGNIDGMVFYRKYAQFNDEKNAEYVRFCMEIGNEICEKLSAAGVKTYMWHHELEVPEAFKSTFPEICNQYGDVEITHPIIKDFLENKIADFFAAYPKMDGIVLTLHETRIPLLKLKNQKLSKIERVKYVTEILYNSCKALGKELIVRPFASIEEDYEMMTHAYEQISHDMVIMDKWTQFDWSLTLPENQFFNKIQHNPLLVETDIFGEYFGLGILPIMLKKHILKNYSYCEKFAPLGYMSRIDRATFHSFGDVNEVNYHIMEAYETGSDVEAAIDRFFAARYPGCGPEVRELMENTEDIQRQIFYLNDYYFTEGSRFPRINHSKNHFYFEMMKEEHYLLSGEWFIPKKWERGTLESLRAEKQAAVSAAEQSLTKLRALEGKLTADDYAVLSDKFNNLYYVAKAWQQLTEAFIYYTKFFELKDAAYETGLYQALDALLTINQEAMDALGKKFYINQLAIDQILGRVNDLPIPSFVESVKASFAHEKVAMAELEAEPLTDFVVCGGGYEGHKLKKEVNFSDTYIHEDGLCRIPGTNRGKKFSSVNAHGWFSYELKVKPNAENTVEVTVKGTEGQIDLRVTIGEQGYDLHEATEGKKTFALTYAENAGADAVRIRFDRISGYTPYIYTVKVR
ncbi:MAG: hypothetical protein IJC17_00810 [Clostridia bacterium]|nr:hypothetical protein [Clostridia bacterium]